MTYYLIWSNEHRAWWGPAGWGYSTGLDLAGRYSRKEALKICRKAIPTSALIGTISEIPVCEADVREFLKDEIIPKAILEGKEDE